VQWKGWELEMRAIALAGEGLGIPGIRLGRVQFGKGAEKPLFGKF
jgi:hypothetical protein